MTALARWCHYLKAAHPSRNARNAEGHRNGSPNAVGQRTGGIPLGKAAPALLDRATGQKRPCVLPLRGIHEKRSKQAQNGIPITARS
jgi:hypothetical protein